MKQDMLQQVLEQNKANIFKQLLKVYKVGMVKDLTQHPNQFTEIPRAKREWILGELGAGL